ncbi:MAG: hypothetical protein Q4C47_05810 [Planctomycetia bacterium]|nr:hypothetical protein [Planctomycetia bacterium]
MEKQETGEPLIPSEKIEKIRIRTFHIDSGTHSGAVTGHSETVSGVATGFFVPE